MVIVQVDSAIDVMNVLIFVFTTSGQQWLSPTVDTVTSDARNLTSFTLIHSDHRNFCKAHTSVSGTRLSMITSPQELAGDKTLENTANFTVHLSTEQSKQAQSTQSKVKVCVRIFFTFGYTKQLMRQSCWCLSVPAQVPCTDAAASWWIKPPCHHIKG